jgi:hypothetical protein
MTSGFQHARRRLLVGAIAFVVATTKTSLAEVVAVPVSVQADLMVKVAAYDRNLPQRAPGRVHVALVVNRGNADSARVVTQMRSILGEVPAIAGLPHDETQIDFADAASLASACRAQGIGILYIGPGLGEQIEEIRRALETVDVLSVAAMAEDVARGIVLGFGLSAGKPKLLINLPQARKQHVAIRPEAVSLMTVLE